MQINVSDKITEFIKEKQNLTLVTKRIAAFIIAGTLGISIAAATKEFIKGEYSFQESGYTYIVKNQSEEISIYAEDLEYKETKQDKSMTATSVLPFAALAVFAIAGNLRNKRNMPNSDKITR